MSCSRRGCRIYDVNACPHPPWTAIRHVPFKTAQTNFKSRLSWPLLPNLFVFSGSWKTVFADKFPNTQIFSEIWNFLWSSGLTDSVGHT
jgi:hypothetical protein